MLKFFKKFSKHLSLLCAFAMVVAMIQPVSANAQATSFDIDAAISSAEANGHRYVYAKITAGGVINDDNSTLKMDDGWVVTTKAGKKAIYSKPNTGYNLFLTPKEEYWKADTNSRAAVTIEYYDTLNASFSLMYSSETSSGYATFGPVVTEGTNTWKTATYYLDDYTTNGSLRIRGCGWSMGSPYATGTYIGDIFVEEGVAEHKLDVIPSNGYHGLIYGYGEEDLMTLNFENTSSEDYTDVTAKAVVYDSNNNIINEVKIDSFAVESGDCVAQEINTGAYECGIYNIELTVKAADDAGVGELYKKNIEFSILRTVEDGKRHPMVGISANMQGQQGDNIDAVSVASRIGIGNFKAALYWDHIEGKAGEYTYGDVTMQCNSYLTENGVSVVFTPSQIPGIYNGGKSNLYYTTDEATLTAFGNFIVDMVEKTGTKTVEILNEINHEGFNHNYDEMKYKGYAKYVKAAYNALHNNGHGDVKVIAGALAGTGGTSWFEKFISSFYGTPDVVNYFDAVSYHPYYYGGFDIADFSKDIDNLYNLVKKPVILTETGWSSANDSETTAAGVSELEKAAYIPEAMIVAQSKGSNVLEGVYIYTLSHYGDYDKVRDYKFGLLKSPMGDGATESFISLAAFCDFFADATFNSKITKDNMKTNAYNFTRAGEDNIAAVWTTKGKDTLALNLGSGCTSINVYDMYGNPKGMLNSDNGIYTFNLTDEIVYIEGEFTSFSEATAEITQTVSSREALLDDEFSITVKDTKKRNLNISLEYDVEALRMNAPAALTDGTATISGITGEKAGHYNITVTLSDDDDNVYYRGTSYIDIDGSAYGSRINSSLDSAASAIYDPETRIVTVAGTLNNLGPNENATLLVSNNETHQIAYIGQTKLYDQNLFEQFKMAADNEGTYTIKAYASKFEAPVTLTEIEVVKVEEDDNEGDDNEGDDNEGGNTGGGTGGDNPGGDNPGDDNEEDEPVEENRISTVQGGVTYYDKATRTVTIKGSLADWKADDDITFIVAQDGFTGREVNKIKYIAQTKLDSATLDYKFTMPQNSPGHYNVYVCGNMFTSKAGLGFNTIDTAYVSGFTVGEEETLITASAMLQNVFSAPKTVNIIIVQYNDKNQPVSVKFEPTTVPAYTTEMIPCTCQIARESDATRVVAYVWDSFTGLAPIADVIELN